MKNLFIVFSLAAFASISFSQNQYKLKLKADSLYQSGNYKSAISEYKNYLRQNSEDVDAKLILGKLLLFENNISEAEIYLSEIIETAPEYLDAYEMLANVYILKNNLNRAVELLDRAFKIDKTRSDVKIKSIRLRVEQDDIADAKSRVDKFKLEFPDLNLPYDVIKAIHIDEIKGTSGYESVKGLDDWNEAGLIYIRKNSRQFSYFASLERYYRFNISDAMFTLGSYFKFPEKINWTASFGISFANDLLPKYRFDIEAQPQIMSETFLAAGASFLKFDNDGIKIYSAGLERYFYGIYSFFYKFYISQNSRSHLFRLNCYADKFSLSIGVAVGDEIYSIITPFENYDFKMSALSSFAFGGYQLTDNFKILGELGFTERSDSHSRFKFGAGIGYRF